MRSHATLHYVGAGRRSAAGLIDVALVLALVLAVALAVLIAGAGTGGGLDGTGSGTGTDRGDILLWLLVALPPAQVLLWWLLGGTPGMFLMGCLVLDANSARRLSLSRSLLRCLGFWLCVLALGLGFAWVVTDRRHQGLHDKLAGSVVVREDESSLSIEELAEKVN